MKGKLFFASTVTLGMIAGFVFALLLVLMYLGDFISAPILIILTLLFNFVVWLVGPFINDIIYRWFYKIKFYRYEEVKDKDWAKFIKKICDEHKIKFPKIGIIHDNNPTAFTYGSYANNARVVFTEGLAKYLDKGELEAVLAHEMGHVVHRDFIVMTIASTLVTILYEIYIIFTRVRIGANRSKSRGYLVFVGIASYIFYIIATYLLLYLSRTREYFADEFAAKKVGDGNLLSSALVKIAYGIVKEPGNKRLLEATKSLGLVDYKFAKDTGLMYENSKFMEKLDHVFLFDLVNPWAFFLELKSTHPLIAKRVRALNKYAKKKIFDFDRIMAEKVDKKKLWSNFAKDVLIGKLNMIVFAFFLVVLAVEVLLAFIFNVHAFFLTVPTAFVFISLVIIVAFVVVNYRFPKKGFEKSSVLDLMTDVYASPVRGKPTLLEGKAIGRGRAGAKFSEDMMFQDRTGLIYLNYESWFPFLGNLFFGWKKLQGYLDKKAEAKGWFMRGATHHIELFRFITGDKVLKSYNRFFFVFAMILISLVISLIMVVLSFVAGLV